MALQLSDVHSGTSRISMWHVARFNSKDVARVCASTRKGKEKCDQRNLKIQGQIAYRDLKMA